MDETALSSLLALGLTRHQARAYVALLQLGEAGAYGVARFAHLPAANTYGALRDLVERGAARLLPGRPRRFRATAPDAWLPALADSLAETAQAAARELAALPPAEEATGEAHEGEWQGNRAIRRFLRERLESWVQRIMLEAPGEEWTRWRDLLQAAGHRGAQVAGLVRAPAPPFAPPAGWLVAADGGDPTGEPQALWVFDDAAFRVAGRGAAVRARLLEDRPYADGLARGILARIGWVLSAARTGDKPSRDEGRAARLWKELSGP